MTVKKFVALGILGSILLACSESASFKGGVASKAILESDNSTPTPSQTGSTIPGEDAVANKPDSIELSYEVQVEGGTAFTPQQLANAIPAIREAGSTRILSADELKNWTVKIHRDDDSSVADKPVAPQTVDLSQSSGVVNVIADFNNDVTGKSGSASQTLFVDGEAPKVTLLRISDAADNKSSDVMWSATDNYKLDESKSVLLACNDYIQTLKPRSRKDLNSLPSSCVIVSEGAVLTASPAQLTIKSPTIAGAVLPSKNARYALYAEDMVGLSAFVWAKTAEQQKGILLLTAGPSGITYTKSTAGKIDLKLVHVEGGSVTQVDDAANSSIWPEIDLVTTATPAANNLADQSFKPSIPATLGPSDGSYSYVIQAKEKETGVLSNKQTVVYVLDTIAPKVDTIQITIDKTIPTAESTIAVIWNASDANPIASQTVEIKLASSTVWTKLASVNGTTRTYSFPWGTRPSGENFSVRVTATDGAGNVGSGNGIWVKQIFNAAVITSSTECFFCHMKIEGDVGGINFPANAALRSDSGRDFEVIGKMYGTNLVPVLLGKHATGGTVDNYDNSGYKIFPKDEKFPILTAANLKPRMKGSVSIGTEIAFNDIYDGNLILDGSKGKPINIRGEVFIDGDLIIKGKYKGVGSIYAKNIYIVNDLTATKSPFPFATDPAAAMTQAQASVVRGDDGLYLGALGAVVVGSLENGLNLTKVNPYSWITKADFNALGVQAKAALKLDGTPSGLPTNSCCSGDPTVDPRFRNEVAQVDAYLYSQTVVSWRAYGNIVLNGGFMTPKGGFVTTLPGLTWNRADRVNLAPNPRNGMPVNLNLVRYDYRLKIGGGGFETLKTFFDQQ